MAKPPYVLESPTLEGLAALIQRRITMVDDPQQYTYEYDMETQAALHELGMMQDYIADAIKKQNRKKKK